MGSFFGHIDEGLVFILLAVWWLWKIWKTLAMKPDHTGEYTSRLSYSMTIRGRNIPLESILKIVFTFGAFWAEIIDAKTFINEEGDFSNLSDLQHSTIYMLFFIHGVVDLLTYFKPRHLDGMNYFTISLAFFWYGTTFYYHSMPTMGKPELENTIHRLPIPLIMTAGLCFIFECIWRHSVYPQLIRSFCVLTAGTWFTHASFVLFLPYPFPGAHHNPAWDQHDERNVHFMVAALGIHLNINLIFILVSYVILTLLKGRFNFLNGDEIKSGKLQNQSECKYSLLDSADEMIINEDNV